MINKSLLASGLASTIAFSSLLVLVPEEADAFGCGNSNRRGPSYSGLGYNRNWSPRRSSSSEFRTGKRMGYRPSGGYGPGHGPGRKPRSVSSGFGMSNQRDTPTASSYGPTLSHDPASLLGYQPPPGGYGNPRFGHRGYGQPRGYDGAGFNPPGG